MVRYVIAVAFNGDEVKSWWVLPSLVQKKRNDFRRRSERRKR